MLRAFFLIKTQSLKSALQYPANFLLNVVAVSLTGFSEVLVILLLTGAFQAIGGWSFWQVGFMAALWRLSHSLHHALFMGFWDHHWLVRDGVYDFILVRPAHPLLQILASGLPLDAIGELLPAAVLFAITAGHVVAPWTLANILFLLLVVVSGALIEWAVYLVFCTLDFWFPEEGLLWVVNAFLFPTTRYPAHIYGPVFLSLLTFVFPFAFIAYYPTYHFFHQVPAQFPAVFPYLSPLVAALAVTVALRFWSFGLSHYQSTGS